MENKDIKNDVPIDPEAKAVDLNELLQSLDPEKREIVARAIYAIEEHKAFSGPLPAPEDFMAYKHVLPQAPERILAMAEKQADHRIETEKKIVEAGIRESKHGQYLGALIVVLCLAGSVYLGMNGHDWLAGSMVAIIAAVGTIFVLQKEPSNDEGALKNNDNKATEKE